MIAFRSCLGLWIVSVCSLLPAQQSWPQFKFDALHSGNAPDRAVKTPLGLAAAIPLTDAVFTAPAVGGGKIFVLDGAGVLHCVDEQSMRIRWRFASDGGDLNCNNYCSPVLIGNFVHFGTMAGDYYVLDAERGTVVRKIACGDPIFSCPVVGPETVYFATLGSRVYAVNADGQVRWQWDYVQEVLQFDGDRWDGEAWARFKKGRVTWREQFLCSRNLAAIGSTLVIPAGGSIVWLKDAGDHAERMGGYAPNESPATLGLSLDEKGTIYQQWFRRDNGGRVETLKLGEGKIFTDFVPGSETGWQSDESMSFSSVSIRDSKVYRCRPEQDFGLCLHEDGKTTPLGDCPSIAPPILTADHAIVSGLDGRVSFVPLTREGTPWSFQTPFRKPITAPVAVANGHVYFGGEDGYLYILSPEGQAAAPTTSLELTRIRRPLSGERTASQYDWFTHFGNQSNTNRSQQDVRPPFRMRWIRRCEGTIKHLSTCGGGRLYTHTAEGQVFAVEQETGRLLWRAFYPGVHVSFTTPAYHKEKLLLPQAGLTSSRLRCLDAATGQLLWETPFTGSPSWNRQLPPLIYQGLVIYQFSSGKYTRRNWLFEHQSTFGFGADQKPLVKAWNLDTGEEVWSADFSQYGQGGDDAGMCLSDEGTLFYSCYFGDKKPSGVTAALDPQNGELKWVTTKHSVHAGCTPSVAGNRLYLGGYNPVEDKINRVWCLDTTTGNLVWKSDPIERAIHVVTVGDGKLFTHAQYRQGYLLDPADGHKICELTHGYRCTRFTMDGHYLLGPNMDVIDTADDNRLISSGPAVDVLQCVGTHVSNGRLFYTANGSGLQLSLSYGKEAESFRPPWRRDAASRAER